MEKDTAKENLKHFKISYQERQQHLQTQHDPSITKLHTSLKQKEDDNNQGSGSNDIDVELHMAYVLSDSLIQTLNQPAIFLWDQYIPYLQW